MSPLSHLRLVFAAILVAAAGMAGARASDAIAAPAGGKSATVTQPHGTAELIPESTLVTSGKPFDVILHLHMDPGWHTYWINPGDAGLATTIKWSLPAGFSPGPIQWPTPEKHAMGPLITYGYGGDVYLLTTITAGKAPSGRVVNFPVKARADWLVCQEECIPGKANLEMNLSLAAGDAVLGFPVNANSELFAAARARLPVPNTRWDVKGLIGVMQGGVQTTSTPPPVLFLQLSNKPGMAPSAPGKLTFFPEQPNVLATSNQPTSVNASDKALWEVNMPLQQNGEKPDTLSGVLVSDQPLIGEAKAVYLSSFSTHDTGLRLPLNSVTSELMTKPGAEGTGLGPSPATTGNLGPPAAAPFLLAVLGAAFLGGLILNLMPCVLPVLSLKVFSLIKHAGENSGTAWRQGLAFTAGVIISFWILAGLLLVLRAAGNHLGWGFQMQSPGFVLALTFLFFLLGLNLFGVFELGTSLVGLDAKASSHLGGLTSSFANGALATLAATPCTAPFMGSSVGFAAQQPPAIALLIFTFLALGMAAPYLALTTFPGALRLVPRPGPWMESLRQVMGFLLLATVIFLIYVLGALVGQDQVPNLLGALLLAGVAAWIYGRWGSPLKSPGVRGFSIVLALVVLGAAIAWGAELAKTVPASSEKMADGWEAYSPGAVEQALAAGRPVFVDFTAAWCLSCKVNERVALDIDSTKQAFTRKNVLLLRGDWTHSDSQITETLRKFNRDGVPLYLLYSPKDPDHPQILPEVLTPGIVRVALQKL